MNAENALINAAQCLKKDCSIVNVVVNQKKLHRILYNKYSVTIKAIRSKQYSDMLFHKPLIFTFLK